jgi:hypothetical protein
LENNVRYRSLAEKIEGMGFEDWDLRSREEKEVDR